MTLEELRNMTDEGRKALLENMGQEKIKRLAYYFMEFIEIMSEPEMQARWGALKKALEIAKADPDLKDCNIEDDRFFDLFESLLSDPSTTQAEAKKRLAEMLISIVPKTAVKPINKLSQEITRGLVDDGQTALVVGNTRNVKNVITTMVTLSSESKSISLTGRLTFTPYDLEVEDAIATLWAAGNICFSPAIVYRAMNGMTESEYISPQSVGAVTKSIEKARRIMANIDFTQEAAAYRREVEKATYEGYLLACDKVTVNISGKEQEVYKLLRPPILYEYARITGQIISVPIALLQTSGAVRNTEDVIVIRGHLLRAIEGMKSPKFKRSNNIAFDALYEKLDITPDNCGMEATTRAGKEAAYKKKTASVRKHVDAILNEWQRQKYIKGHEIYKTGNSITGVTILLGR